MPELRHKKALAIKTREKLQIAFRVKSAVCGGTEGVSMNSIINLTQHPATVEQLAAGVFDLTGESWGKLTALLTFSAIPTAQEISSRAHDIALLVALEHETCTRCMIGGALWLMAPLASALREQGIEPLFAFTIREAVEEKQPDGSIRKTAVFRHAGFVPAVE